MPAITRAVLTAAFGAALAAQPPEADDDDRFSLLQLRASARVGPVSGAARFGPVSLLGGDQGHAQSEASLAQIGYEELAPAASLSGGSRGHSQDGASLDQAAYEQVAALKSTPAMSAFIKGLVESRGGAISDEWALHGFAPYHSGEEQTQNFKHLLAELKRAKWTGLADRAEERSGTSTAGSALDQIAAVEAPTRQQDVRRASAAISVEDQAADVEAPVTHPAKVIQAKGGSIASAPTSALGQVAAVEAPAASPAKASQPEASDSPAVDAQTTPSTEVSQQDGPDGPSDLSKDPSLDAIFAIPDDAANASETVDVAAVSAIAASTSVSVGAQAAAPDVDVASPAPAAISEAYASATDDDDRASTALATSTGAHASATDDAAASAPASATLLAVGAQTVALDGDGYQRIVALHDTEAMALYIQRLVAANGGQVAADVADDLRLLASKHCEGGDAGSFENLVHELRTALWTGDFALHAARATEVPAAAASDGASAIAARENPPMATRAPDHTASLLEGESVQVPPPAAGPAVQAPAADLAYLPSPLPGMTSVAMISSAAPASAISGEVPLPNVQAFLPPGADVPPVSAPVASLVAPVEALAVQPVTLASEPSEPPAQLAAAGAGATAVASLALDQAGYKQVVDMHNTAMMGAFITRVVESLGGEVKDQISMQGFAPFHSGELGEQTFDRLVEELRGFKWSGLADATATALPSPGGAATHIHIGAVMPALALVATAPVLIPTVAPSEGAAPPSLDQLGYKSVVEMRSTAAMQEYIRRVVESLGGHVGDMNSLKGFAPYHSGEQGQQTYDRLVNELRGFKWTGLKDQAASGAADAAPPPVVQSSEPAAADLAAAETATSEPVSKSASGAPSLDQAGYKKVVSMHSSAAMGDFITQVVESLGGSVDSMPSLKGFAPFHSGEQGEQTFDRLVKELYTFKWTGLKDKLAGQEGPAVQGASPASPIAAAAALSAAVADLAPVSALVPATMQQPPPAAAAVQPIDILEGKAAGSAGGISPVAPTAGLPSAGGAPIASLTELAAVTLPSSGTPSLPPSQVVQTATFDEAGYQRVAQLGNTDAMTAYMKRLVRHVGGTTPGARELAKLAPLHSGEKGVQDYASLCRDLELPGLAMMETGATVVPLPSTDGYVA